MKGGLYELKVLNFSCKLNVVSALLSLNCQAEGALERVMLGYLNKRLVLAITLNPSRRVKEGHICGKQCNLHLFNKLAHHAKAKSNINISQPAHAEILLGANFCGAPLSFPKCSQTHLSKVLVFHLSGSQSNTRLNPMCCTSICTHIYRLYLWYPTF